MIVTTAAVPGRPAPKIISAAMVAGMKPGSVIVDLAAETGGNCELTRPGENIEIDGVTVAGPLNLASMGALHASEMYARNVFNFLSLMLDKEGQFDARLGRRADREDLPGPRRRKAQLSCRPAIHRKRAPRSRARRLADAGPAALEPLPSLLRRH